MREGMRIRKQAYQIAHLTSLVQGGFSLIMFPLLPQHVYQVSGHSADHGRVCLLLLQVLQHLSLQLLPLLLASATASHIVLLQWLANRSASLQGASLTALPILCDVHISVVCRSRSMDSQAYQTSFVGCCTPLRQLWKEGVHA